MAKLVSTVFVKDPDRHGVVVLEAGEEPEPRLAALVTNPEAWEGGKLPIAAQKTAQAEEQTASAAPSQDDEADDKPATAKKAAATKPARGRKSADGEGNAS